MVKLSFMKVVNYYNKVLQKVNEAVGAQDFAMMDDILGHLFSIDVHIFAKELRSKL